MQYCEKCFQSIEKFISEKSFQTFVEEFSCHMLLAGNHLICFITQFYILFKYTCTSNAYTGCILLLLIDHLDDVSFLQFILTKTMKLKQKGKLEHT